MLRNKLAIPAPCHYTQVMFQASIPVTAGAFLDRRSELERLTRLLADLESGSPTWLAILGSRKIGKTSLLLELARRSAGSRTAFVILDTFEQSPLSPEVFRRYALRLLDALFAEDIGRSLEAAFRDPTVYRKLLISSDVLLQLPGDLRADILGLPDRPVDAQLQRDVLEWPERLAEATDRTVLVAWDEFQALARLGSGRKGADPIPLMRSVWQRHHRTAYVISGSERSMLLDLVTEEHSPFFQHFTILELGPFSEVDAVDLLVRNAPDERPVPTALAERIVDLVTGHPFYLQLAGEALTAMSPPYDEPALKEAMQALLFSSTGRLGLYFENRHAKLVGRSAHQSRLLQTLSSGPIAFHEIVATTGTPSGAVATNLGRLGDDVIQRPDGRYELRDPTFARWLQWRGEGGTAVPMTVLGDAAERRVADELAWMGFELVYRSRASRGAFDLLAIRGPARLGVQVKRTALPVRFRKAEWTRFEAEGERLGWTAVVAAVPPDEVGGVTFLEPAKVRLGREARLAEDARIGNLLRWLEKV